MPPTRTITGRGDGFTLIELLVVISLITLLIAMIQPSFYSARKRAQTANCLAQLSQIGRAADAYSVENLEMVARDHWYDNLNPATRDYRHFSFLGRYSGYAGGPNVSLEEDSDPSAKKLIEAARVNPVWRCPAEPDPRFVLTYVSNGVDFGFYAKSKVYDSGAMSRVTHLPASPSAVMNLTEANTLNFQSPTGIGTYDVFTPDRFIYMGTTAIPTPRMMKHGDPKHLDVVPMLFFDTHAEALPMNPRSINIRLLNPLDNN